MKNDDRKPRKGRGVESLADRAYWLGGSSKGCLSLILKSRCYSCEGGELSWQQTVYKLVPIP